MIKIFFKYMELSVSAANAVFRNATLFQTFFFGEGERDRMLLRWKGEVSVAFNSMEDEVFFLSHSPPTSNPHTPLFSSLHWLLRFPDRVRYSHYIGRM